MGKRFRYGLATAVVVAATFPLAAIYAIRHPDSYLTRYSVVVVNLGMEPLIELGQTIIERAARAVIRASSHANLVSQDPGASAPEEPQAIHEVAPAETELLAPVDNPIIQAVREQLPPVDIPRDAEPPLADEPGDIRTEHISNPALLPEVIIGPSSNIPDAEEKMPRCFDDDEEPPSRMPRADQADLGENNDVLFQFWMNLFRGAAEEMNGQEESEPVIEERLSPCQEDPAYHYQYPGCPFTGKWPFGKDQGGRMKDENVHPSSFILHPSDGPDMDPNLLHVPERLKRLLPQAGSVEDKKGEPLPEPNVDTTEFRPSDAKPGEFDPKPM